MSDYTHPNERHFVEGSEKYDLQWNQLQTAWIKGRMPHALLFVGALECVLTDFIMKLTQLIFCSRKGIKPCFECSDCTMAALGEHPDMNWIKPDKRGGAIKIDQIRKLQSDSFLTPQRAPYRLIVIESADRMNSAAANSLLKILEEPAPHTLFLLVAQQLSTVLPTVLSRCQIVRFASCNDASIRNLLQLVEHYPPESDQAMIMKQSELLLDGLIAVIEEKEHPCIVATQWSQFELNSVLWLLYLVYAQIQLMHTNIVDGTGPVIQKLKTLMSLLSPTMIFIQIDKINTLKRKLSHNINVNQTLALEDLLMFEVL